MSKRNVEFRRWEQAQINAAAEWLEGEARGAHGDPDGVMDFGRPELTADGIQLTVKAAGLRGNRSSLATCRVPVAWRLTVDNGYTVTVQGEIDGNGSRVFDVHAMSAGFDAAADAPTSFDRAVDAVMGGVDFADLLGADVVDAIANTKGAPLADVKTIVEAAGFEQVSTADAFEIYDAWIQSLRDGGAQ